MKRRTDILERVVNGADLSTESLPKLPLVEILEDRRVLIENHCGVFMYERNEVRIKVCYGHVCVKGANLKLLQMTKAQLVIAGDIHCVYLIRR